MRHFLLAGPIATLTFGVPMAARQTALVAVSGLPHAALSHRLRTGTITVAVAAITVAANHHRRAAPRAQVASSGKVHRFSGPMGLDGNVRFVKYSAGNVALRLRARYRL